MTTPFLIKIPRGKVYFSSSAFRETFSAIVARKVFRGGALLKFEDEFAKYIGTKYAIATSSGTVSLYLCLKALDIKKGEEIIVSAYTVPEIVAIIVYYGAKPVFVDIDPGTYNMNPHLIEERVSPKTKFLLLTHIYGQPCDIDLILKVARKYSLKVIEDCAQACGAEYRGKKVGSFSHLAYFSFSLMKNLNTLGGGAITTNNGDLADKIRKEISTFKYPKGSELTKRLIFASILSFFTHPLPFTIFVFPIIRLLNLVNDNLLYNLLEGKKELNLWYGISKSCTTENRASELLPSAIFLNQTTLPEKYRVKFTNLQAAIGLKQLEELDMYNNMRIENAKILTNVLKDSGLKIPHTLPYVKSIYLNYVIQVKNKKRIIKKLLKRGIDVTEGYVKSCSDLEEFQRFKTDCPISDALSRDNLYLPIQPPLGERHMTYIADCLKKLIDKR